VRRLAYRHRGEENLYPADGTLNLAEELYSHGLRRWAAEEASKGSFDQAVTATESATGQHVPKRQVEELAKRAAADFERFYEDAKKAQAATSDLLVISADGKGVVMRPDALRPATAKAAASKKLATRLSKGERPYRKRMAVMRNSALRPSVSDPPGRPADPRGAVRGRRRLGGRRSAPNDRRRRSFSGAIDRRQRQDDDLRVEDDHEVGDTEHDQRSPTAWIWAFGSARLGRETSGPFGISGVSHSFPPIDTVSLCEVARHNRRWRRMKMPLRTTASRRGRSGCPRGR
jgi:hypothetical protein